MKKVNLINNGFIRREDLDFTDDGARFQGYEYNGVPLTKTTYKGEYFISISISNMNNLFTYSDYADKEWYSLCDKYNGVTEVDIEDLKKCIKIIKEGVEALNKQVAEEVIDYSEFDKQALLETMVIDGFISTIKLTDILKLDEYKSKKVIDYLISLKRVITIIKNKMEKHYRYDYKTFIRLGYVAFDMETDFRVIQIKQILGI